MPQPEATDLTATRKEYTRGRLDRSDLDEDPVIQFSKWFSEISEASSFEPNAVALATSDASGRVSARMVLAKRFDESGFVFATSYLGRKARDIQENPFACLLFYWPELERQVRIEGRIELAEPEISSEIFDARPRESQLAAATSRQSEPVGSRGELEDAFDRLSLSYEGRSVERPESWGAYRLVPDRFEFWQGGRNRLHDRFEYNRSDVGWKIQRLQP